MLAIKGHPQFDFQETGCESRAFPVRWVTIEQPDPDLAGGRPLDVSAGLRGWRRQFPAAGRLLVRRRQHLLRVDQRRSGHRTAQRNRDRRGSAVRVRPKVRDAQESGTCLRPGQRSRTRTTSSWLQTAASSSAKTTRMAPAASIQTQESGWSGCTQERKDLHLCLEQHGLHRRRVGNFDATLRHGASPAT